MSVSLYRWTEECEQDPQCVGDCDLCRKETMLDKYDEVGIPTALERVSQQRAKPIEECIYPSCEGCDKYHGHYCTVPMVVSKQIWLTTESLIARMEKRLTELETLVTDEILRSRPRTYNTVKETNFTWDDYLGEDK